MSVLDWHSREPGAGLEVESAAVDPAALYRSRMARLKAEMRSREIPAVVLTDPVNVRYATGARNMQVFSSRNPARYLFVALEGPTILFEFEGCHHLADGLDTIDEVQPAITVSYVAAAERLEEMNRRWTAQVADLLKQHNAGSKRVGVERFNPLAVMALEAEGFEVLDAQEPVERARAIKTPEELPAIRASIAATERAVARLREAIEPGITENQLWSVLHASVIADDCDYVETRLLNSGVRTNPWFQETGGKVIEPGELIALDTDVVGCFGYYADFSRTFFCGPGKPSDAQRRLYATASEQVRRNVEAIRPGMSFRELSETGWRVPEEYMKHRYFVLAHGVGMTGEYPYVLHDVDFDDHGYDGVIEPGMTLCVESFIGHEAGGEGVKMEDQVLVTEEGVEPLSRFPYEDDLLGREV